MPDSNIYKDLKLEFHHFFDCEKEDETATREEIMEVIDRLKEIPIQPLSSADYVKVVRCKNCKWYEVSEFVTDKNEALGYCYFHEEPWWENEYCSHGEGRCKNDM